MTDVWFNRTEREIYPAFDAQAIHVGGYGEILFDTGLEVIETVNPTGLNSLDVNDKFTTNLNYGALARDYGLFTRDNTGIFTVVTSGIYNITIVSGFQDVGKDGIRKHALILNRNATDYELIRSTKVCVPADAPNGTVLDSNITTVLIAGDTFKHVIGARSTIPGNITLTKTDDVGSQDYTRITVLYLNKL